MFKMLSLVAADWVSNLIGYAAIADWSPGIREGETLLDIPAYTQIDSYSCGAVAGFQVVKAFYPEVRFEDFYSEVSPDPVRGTSSTVLVKALRRFGVVVGVRKHMDRKQLIGAIDKCRPVILAVRNAGAAHYHWVVVRGFSCSHVILAGNGIPIFHRRRLTWKEFRGIWKPSGNGLVCS